VQTLPDADEQLQAIFQAFPDLLFVMDRNGTIVDYKAGDPNLLFQLPGEFLGRKIQEVLPSGSASRFDEALKYLRVNQTITLDFPLILRGKELWFEARLVLMTRGKVITFIRDITSRKRSELSVRQQLDRMSALRAIDMAITTSPDLELTLSILVQQVRTQLQVDAACILLVNRKTNTLEFATGDGFRTEALQHTSLEEGMGYAGQAASTRQIVRVPNLTSRDTDFLRSPYFSQEGFVDYFAIPLVAKMQMLGVLEIFHRSPLNPQPDWLDFMNMLAGQAAIAIDSAVMFHDFEETNSALTTAYDATIEGWSRALELRDRETQGHTKRVTKMVTRLAALLGMSQDEIVHIRRGAALHDIGKMAIPDQILFKPGPLDPREWEVMRQHTSIAAELLKPIPYLAPAMEIPEYHHEKWDGTGYPRGLREEQIPRAARLFAAVDVYDALTSDRPYRKAWSHKDAVAYIQGESGKHFDPKVIEAFSRMMEHPPAD
jgi:PAS domain S-box-containing protein